MEECEEVADKFEAAHPEFEPSPSYWASTRLPSLAIEGHRIRLDPSTTQTDAFFIASWRRKKPGDNREDAPGGSRDGSADGSPDSGTSGSSAEDSAGSSPGSSADGGTSGTGGA